MGCISLASLSWSLRAKTETLVTASSERREGRKMSDISAVRPCRYSSHIAKSGCRQVSRSSLTAAAKRIGMVRTTLEENTIF